MSVRKQNQEAFAHNYKYLKSLKAVYCFRWKVKNIGVVPHMIVLYIFDTLVHPVLTHGSDVWGISKKELTQFVKIFLHFARCVRTFKM